ncbi:MAG TPA: alpha/beta fold hydrolase [Streptosporangiaceae bacterium]|nr:alpha/beta fold hydrolase [Streptosporangiaceae bacterium]
MPDEQVRSAIANWAPRFTAQGVDVNDFTRVTAGIERWEDWLGAWCANGDLHAGLAREAEERGCWRTAGEAWIAAALSFHFAKFVWMVDMAAHDAAAARAVAAMANGLRLLDPAAERIEVAFGGTTMAGHLRRPAGAERPPLVLLIAGLDSTKEEFFAVENIFLARGMATFSLDGPGQGETAARLKIRPDFEAPVAAVLDVLCERPDLDGGRAGLLGVSLGGYYGARAAAFEPRLRAVAVSGGCYDFGALIRGRPAHSFATFAYACGAATREEAYEVAGQMTLAGVAERITQPMVVVSGKLDRLVPWQHAAQVAAEARSAELWLFDEGNHVCMNLAYRWRPQAADWLASQLLQAR